MSIHPVGAVLFHTDGQKHLTEGRTDRQTDRDDEGNIRISKFCKRA